MADSRYQMHKVVVLHSGEPSTQLDSSLSSATQSAVRVAVRRTEHAHRLTVLIGFASALRTSRVGSSGRQELKLVYPQQL